MDLGACTVFILNSNGRPFVAKNLGWTSRFQSITFNQFGKEFPLGGMNERGLVMEELNVSPVGIGDRDAAPAINEFQLVQYVLDNCATVAEAMDEITLLHYSPLILQLHYFLVDSSGNFAVIEFDGNKFKSCTDEGGKPPFLSNNRYRESIEYLQKFKGFGGELPVHHRKGSNERFVSASKMLSDYKEEEPLGYAFAMLDTVSQKDTRWSIVYDIEHMSIYARVHQCPDLKIIRMGNLDPSKDYSGVGFNLNECTLTTENDFHRVSREENTLHQK